MDVERRKVVRTNVELMLIAVESEAPLIICRCKAGPLRCAGRNRGGVAHPHVGKNPTLLQGAYPVQSSVFPAGPEFLACIEPSARD